MKKFIHKGQLLWAKPTALLHRTKSVGKFKLQSLSVGLGLQQRDGKRHNIQSIPYASVLHITGEDQGK